MIKLSRFIAMFAVLVSGACAAGNVYLPGDPGGAKSDISGQPDRDLWLLDNEDAPDDIRAAIEEGILIPGMTTEHRDVVTNSDRRSTTGYGYWRSRDLVSEIRYQWYVADLREPFNDNRGRAICELVFVDETLSDIRYCDNQPDS